MNVVTKSSICSKAVRKHLNCADKDMPSNTTNDELYESLRQLAAQDPRAARAKFVQLLDSGDVRLQAIFEHASAPGEGRIRQMIANVVRERVEKNAMVPQLALWLERETDEFARRAIEYALEGVDFSSHRMDRQHEVGLADPSLVRTYRYLASRMRHRLNNSLLGAHGRLVRLRQELRRFEGNGQSSKSLQLLIVQLEESFQKVARHVEFDGDDDFFRIRPIRLLDWLDQNEPALLVDMGPVRIEVRSIGQAADAVIKGSDYFLLQTIFWNLIANARQAVDGEDCLVTVEASIRGEHVEFIILDNGPGFPASASTVAFQEQHSTKNPNRGRGLLEVQDAVERLGGSAQLFEFRPGDLRILLRFPASSS
jgi:signal transduction histidine kinase